MNNFALQLIGRIKNNFIIVFFLPDAICQALVSACAVQLYVYGKQEDDAYAMIGQNAQMVLQAYA